MHIEFALFTELYYSLNCFIHWIAGDIPLDGGDGMLELHFDDPKSVRPSYDDPIENDFGDDIPMDIDLDLHESSSGGSPEVAIRNEGPGSTVASPVHEVPPVPEALPRANDLSDNGNLSSVWYCWF